MRNENIIVDIEFIDDDEFLIFKLFFLGQWFIVFFLGVLFGDLDSFQFVYVVVELFKLLKWIYVYVVFLFGEILIIDFEMYFKKIGYDICVLNKIVVENNVIDIVIKL